MANPTTKRQQSQILFLVLGGALLGIIVYIVRSMFNTDAAPIESIMPYIVIGAIVGAVLAILRRRRSPQGGDGIRR